MGIDQTYLKKLPTALLDQLTRYEPTLWLNPEIEQYPENLSYNMPLTHPDMVRSVDQAEARLQRFRPFLASAFEDTKPENGLIESPLVPIEKMKSWLSSAYNTTVDGSLWLKADNALPISGSIKARGGIHEVLKHAEDILIKHGNMPFDLGMINGQQDGYDYLTFLDPEVQAVLSNYRIVVGSTGNLGLSIGIISAKLGFSVEVHMSSDAKQWKMDLLREKGAQVVAHKGDYSEAVSAARRLATEDPNTYFVDDEHSQHLFAGYAVGGRRLKAQLESQGIEISAERPLYVYLPCGVGGGPGGVTFGLKEVFGSKVHCYFVEPTHAPCMLLSLASGLGSHISVGDIGLDLHTAADGLAVGRSSQLVADYMQTLLDGVATVSDESLFEYLKALVDTEDIWLEPSALAGFQGLMAVARKASGNTPETRVGPVNDGKSPNIARPVHVVWATGGGMVPPAIRQINYDYGTQIIHEKQGE